MGNDVSVERVRPDQLGLCAQLIRESFRTVAEEFGFTPENAPRFTAFAVTRERLQHQFSAEKRPMFVCRVDGAPVGYYSLLPQGERCELNNLCVVPSHRHRGIGAMLLRSAFEQAALLGCTALEIGIVEENRRLREWYERFGFVHTGTRKFDFFPFTCGTMRAEIKENGEAKK